MRFLLVTVKLSGEPVAGSLGGIDMRVTDWPKKRVFKRWSSVAIACLVSTFFVVMTVLFGGVAAEGPFFDDRKDHFMVFFLLVMSAGLIWLVLNMGVFTGVEVSRGEVVVKNFLGVMRVPVGSVSGVSWRGGLRVHVGERGAYRCTAFPGSLFSLVIGYRNFRVVARRVECALAEQPEPAPTGPPVERTELRGWLFLWILGGLCALYMLVFLLVRFVF